MLLGTTLAGIPAFVDRVYVVDDASRDATVGRAHAAAANDPRVTVIVHERNRGAGAAVITGYTRALDDGADIVCVMNADNQMDPTELLTLVMPVVNDEVDYTKANRLFTGEAWNLIPHARYLGNAMLSLLTKIASGYWHIADSQAGYTVINRRMLELVDLENVYPRYGYPNDMLVHLNVWSARVRDIPSRPIYGIGEQSGIKLRSVVPRISWLLMKGFFWRMGHRYIIRDFHPLVFFYTAGFFSFLIGLSLGSYAVGRHFSDHPPTAGLAILVALMMTFSVLFTLFAMWFDMDTNKDLR
jgi:glycosyltransferase involved in cell wall biosynthesis